MPSRDKKKRNFILILLIAIIISLGFGYLFYYQTYGKFYESTDNAYVKQNIVYITPQVSGVVDEVNVDVTQVVKKGDVLGRIDSTDIELSFEKSKNDLAQTVREVKRLYRQRDESKSQILFAQVQVKESKDILDRKKLLVRNSTISQEAFNHFQFAYEKAVKNLDVVRKRYLIYKAMLNDKKISQNPNIRNAVLVLIQNYINLKRCDILAPLSGVVAKKNFSVGSRVSTQTTLLAIVPQSGFWVDANFKETQLENIKIGQKVELYSDVYGKDIIYHGKVEGISPGTGSVFSLLPAQNATGNWIKIVQRVPVRIELDKKELQKHPLQVGNSMEVTVDTHDRDRRKLAKFKMQKPDYKSYLYKNALTEAKKIADAIIKQNL